MNDGFNWFVAALLAVGLAAGMMLRPIIGAAAAKWTIVAALIFTVIAIAKFIYTPVKGVEDEQKTK